MTEQLAKNVQLRKDLLIILVLAIIMLATLGVLWYLDSTQQIITTWSHQFYQLLLQV